MKSNYKFQLSYLQMIENISKERINNIDIVKIMIQVVTTLDECRKIDQTALTISIKYKLIDTLLDLIKELDSNKVYKSYINILYTQKSECKIINKYKRFDKHSTIVLSKNNIKVNINTIKQMYILIDHIPINVRSKKMIEIKNNIYIMINRHIDKVLLILDKYLQV